MTLLVELHFVLSIDLCEEFSSLWRENIGLWIQALEPIHGCTFADSLFDNLINDFPCVVRWQFFRLVFRSTFGDMQEMIRIISHVWDTSVISIPSVSPLDIDSMDDVQ